jgi:sterol 3beta-glucosyltransferase
MVERHGVPYAHMDNAVLELTEAVLRAPTRREQRRLFKGFSAIIRAGLEDEWRAAQALQPDALVYHSKALGSHHIAEKLGAAGLLAMPLPLTTTRAFPVPMLPFRTLGGWGNALSYKLVTLGSALWAGATNDFRTKTLGLDALPRFADPMRRRDGSPVPALYAVSEAILPRPGDWPASSHMTGCWFLDEADAWIAPPPLQAFLDSGEPPLYIGFGSMGAARGEERARTVLRALERAGERAVLVTGWGGLKATEVPSNVFVVDNVPHDWLFPRVKAVVHHGGAGTTMAGLRWGKPTVICPFLGDQPFWGHVVHRTGLGSAAVPQAELTSERLALAIRDALQPNVMKRAGDVGGRIQSERGADRAAELIEREAIAAKAT